MKVPAGGLSEEEFEALPSTLRRKYFSSLERLRLAQDGAFPAPSSSRKDRMLRRIVDHERSQPPLQRKASPLNRLSPRRLRKSQSVRHQYLASQVDATWFSSLPQKIQQRQFTREEQVLFAGNRDVVILDAADEAFYRMRRPSHTQLENVGTDLTNKNEQNKDLIDSLAENPADSAVDMDDSFYDSFRWLDEDDDLDLTLDDYHHAVTETAFPPVLGTHRTPSFRRTVSLTSLRPRQASISLRPPQSSHSTVSPIGSGLGSRPLSTIFTPRHERQSSVVSLESSALHYQDPEARLKLRVYLASPQKFDEAVEFGFPSLDNTTFVQPAAPAGTGRRTQETERSFLDDAVSVLPRDYEDDKEEELSLADTESPRTPQDHIFQYSRPSKKSSVERQGVLRPHILRTSPDPYAQGAPGGREMTLHMTLTRPDLRTDTDIKPSAAKMDDPLKLSDLLLSDERHPIWDTPPEDKSKIKKLWKKLTSR